MNIILKNNTNYTNTAKPYYKRVKGTVLTIQEHTNKKEKYYSIEDNYYKVNISKNQTTINLLEDNKNLIKPTYDNKNNKLYFPNFSIQETITEQRFHILSRFLLWFNTLHTDYKEKTL